MAGVPLDPGIRVELVSYTLNGPELVASASKVSLSRKPLEEVLSLDPGEVETWIVETYRRMHFSPWEHSVYTFVVDGLSRVASHQLVRHRIASYTQQSMRYTEGYLRDMALEASRLLSMGCPGKPRGEASKAYACYSKALEAASRDLGGDELIAIAWKAYVAPPRIARRALVEYYRGLVRASAEYYRLLSMGVSKEDARFLIPHAVRTRITVTMNARELVQTFFPLRMCTKAQWEIRLIAWMLWRELSKVHPLLFMWAGPSCVFRENTTRDKPSPLEDYVRGREGFTIHRCPELVERPQILPCLRAAADTLGLGRRLLER
ncbi:MAG: FAD-dependent thymidylate synthase [Desulfurococcales archaeon]|nr:FAD-dependent thymidylate synthase [Desulfurococcales archaeon]